MSEQQAPYYYWSPPEQRVRVIEEAEDIRLAMIVGAPEPPKMWEHPLVVDTEGFSEEIAELAGKEMSVKQLVKLITNALMRHGWTHRNVANDAVALARDIVEGQP